MRNHGANNFALSKINRPIAGTSDFSGYCFISSFENFPGAYENSQMFYRWQLDDFRAQSADKKMVKLINRIFLPFLRSLLSVSIVTRNVEQVRSV
jgi:hypothetical protein